MKVLFSPAACREIDAAARRAESLAPGAGERLHSALQAALPRFEAWQLSYPRAGSGLRQMSLHGQPYRLLYAVEAGQVYVAALAQRGCEPAYVFGGEPAAAAPSGGVAAR